MSFGVTGWAFGAACILHIVDLRTGEQRTIAHGVSQWGYSFSNNVLTYVDNDRNIVVIDVASGEETRIAAQETTDLATDGRYIFWNQFHQPADEYFYDTFGYDLMTHSTFRTPHEIYHARNGAVAWIDSHEALFGESLANVLPSVRQPLPSEVDPHRTYFEATGHYLGWGFRDYWLATGGLPVYGYPLTEEFTERNADTGQTYTVQFTERQRFEWHPENAGTPYGVLLGRLGDELLLAQGRHWIDFATADPNAPHYFAETRHAIDGRFWEYWSSRGLEFGDPGVSFRESLALFGYPLSEPMTETNADGDTVLTQYFERAVFELHPDNPAEWRVLLRRLGVEVLESRGWVERQ
jgi:hypothetical protein